MALGKGITGRPSALGGRCPAIARDPELAAASFGADGPAWRRIAGWRKRMGDRLAAALLAPLPDPGAAWRLGPRNVVRLGLAGIQSSAGWSERHFQTEA